jgi:hypothetical protein
MASDRHVYLDTNGNGQLNDCPNPAHNAKGLAGNTDDLSRCSGGSLDGKIIGLVSGTATSVTCIAGGGAVVSVVNGAQADVDRDGFKEFVYGHPQACVWNMAKSDSCEVHAGTYKKAGAQCDENCGDQGTLGGATGVCDKFDCFKASIVALGDGPNMSADGNYGTASAPGIIEAANMAGSIDMWDPNRDKNPADGSYPAILSGDANANGVFDGTTCAGGVCSGDSFYGAIVGCGLYGYGICRTSPAFGSTYIRIDSNGDGTFDQNVGVFTASGKQPSYLQIRNLEFTRYNGGNGCPAGTCAQNGTRPRTSTIDLNGGGATNGLVVDHIYLHDNDFTLGIDNTSSDNVSNEGYTENHWAGIGDQNNANCTTPTVIANSFLVQNNARLFDADCGVGTNVTCGCPLYIHDNRILVDVDPAKAGVLYRNGGPYGAFTKTHSVVISYLKNIDIHPPQHRFWNNEFVIKSMGSSRGYFMDLQGFGNAQGHNNGSLWLYGNLFRYDPAATQKMSRFWLTFCDIQTGGYAYYLFNNTFDMDVSIDATCSAPGDLVIERNNAYLRATDLHMSTATVVRQSNNAESTASSDRAVWFDAGAFSPGSPGVHGGLANYRPRAGGPLQASGDCDPDDDGIPGADWNGDGIQETQWVDLAGNAVDCSAGGDRLARGAIQEASDVPRCGSGLLAGTACDDANPCTTGDACDSAGTCKGTPLLAPPEVDNGVRVNRSGSTAAVLSWNLAPNATTYDLLRGAISSLPVGPGGGDETCPGNNLVAPTFTDSAVPAVNSGFWYLIRGGNPCTGNGPYGFTGNRGTKGTARATTSCP